ncbi:hypothetical protein OOZ63_03230 [Paucibacter sp. PLA-PC-4]|uniref:hypothetical protein n=1 Tax=Paucibacter sp. PLA-PC-4 TaxID=2993655 RepID=UPI0022492EDC|nr:hypothetical protein [Paucibacter sp. PLA-PC-4]MCX2860846.1 hypothetical protein [Paucibacter sp. PLA-PC-4]
MDSVLSGVFWLTFELLLIGTGRGVVRLLTLGHWRSEKFGGDEGRIYGPAGALSFRFDGQRVITRAGLFVAGLLFYLLAVPALLWLL